MRLGIILLVIGVSSSLFAQESVQDRLRNKYQGDVELSDHSRYVLQEQAKKLEDSINEQKRLAIETKNKADFETNEFKKTVLLDEVETHNRNVITLEKQIEDIKGRVGASFGNYEEKVVTEAELKELEENYKANIEPYLNPDMSELDYYNYLGAKHLNDNERIIEEHLRRRHRTFGGYYYAPVKHSSLIAAAMVENVRKVYKEDLPANQGGLGKGRLSVDYDSGNYEHLAIHTPISAQSGTLGTYNRLDKYGRMYHVTELENYLRYGTVPYRYRDAIRFGVSPATYVDDSTAFVLWRRAVMNQDAYREVLKDAQRILQSNYDMGARNDMTNRASYHVEQTSRDEVVSLRSNRTDRTKERMASRIDRMNRELEVRRGGGESSSDFKSLEQRADANYSSVSGSAEDARRSAAARRDAILARVGANTPDRGLRDGVEDKAAIATERAEASRIGYGEHQNMTIQQAKEAAANLVIE